MEFIDEVGELAGVVRGAKVVDATRGHAEFLQGAADRCPEFLAFLAFCKVEVCDLLTEPLQQFRVEVLVVPFDERLLVS